VSERRKVWRVNLYRLRTRHGYSGESVWPTFTDGSGFYDRPVPPAPGKYDVGSRISGEPFYETEEAAWVALGEQFEAWVTETRGLIERRGVPLPEPKKTRRKKK